MLVKMTLVQGKLDVYLDHAMIRMIGRSKDNPLTTTVMTYFMTPQGPLAYEVTESPSLLADAVNEACRGNVPSTLLMQ